MTVHAWISFGLGGQVFDPPSGERNLVQRLKKIGVNTHESPYAWNDIHTITNEILVVVRQFASTTNTNDNAPLPIAPRIVLGGDSLGDNEVLAVASALRGKCDVHFAFGFQRSGGGVLLPVPDNVVLGVEIHCPNLLLDPFGSYPWIRAPGNHRTVLYNYPIAAPHPGDFGVAQDIIFNYIKALT
jgi:hypothetical protein